MAVLHWVDVGGMRTPIYLSPLDPRKLRRLTGTRATYVYRDETTDPRYEVA